MKKALLVVDYINGIVRDGSCSEWASSYPIVANANQLIQKAREKNIPIYFIRLGFDDSYTGCPKHSKAFNYIRQNSLFRLSESGTDFVEDLNFDPKQDIVMNKTAASPFSGTDLERVLRQQGVEHLIFTGVSTDNAINSGVRYANDQGFYTTIVEDTCGASSEELHDPVLKSLEKIANEIVETQSALSRID